MMSRRRRRTTSRFSRAIENQSERKSLGTDLVIDHTFSARPLNGPYEDYYAKMTTYIAILSGPAQVIDPSVTAKTFPLITAAEEESVFNYIDTSSSRAEINVVSAKLELDKIAIIGLGGTGAYVLELTAKTHTKEIHLFDGDTFFQHNAFRSPGAASGEELEEKLAKTEYFRRMYSKMRRGIFSHPVYIDVANVDQLREMKFVLMRAKRSSSSFESLRHEAPDGPRPRVRRIHARPPDGRNPLRLHPLRHSGSQVLLRLRPRGCDTAQSDRLETHF